MTRKSRNILLFLGVLLAGLILYGYSGRMFEPMDNSTPGSVTLSGFSEIGSMCNKAGCGLNAGWNFNVSEPCKIGPASSACSSTVDIVYKYPDGTEETGTQDITGYTQSFVAFGMTDNNRSGMGPYGPNSSWHPTTVTLTAYNTMNGVKGPVSSPIVLKEPIPVSNN